MGEQEDSTAWLGGALSMRLEGWGQSQTLSWLAKAAISQLMMNKCCFDSAAFGARLVRPEVHINPVVGPGKGMGKGLTPMPAGTWLARGLAEVAPAPGTTLSYVDMEVSTDAIRFLVH